MLFYYPEKPRELLQASQTHNQRSVELEGTLEIHMSKGLILFYLFIFPKVLL